MYEDLKSSLNKICAEGEGNPSVIDRYLGKADAQDALTVKKGSRGEHYLATAGDGMRDFTNPQRNNAAVQRACAK